MIEKFKRLKTSAKVWVISCIAAVTICLGLVIAVLCTGGY